MMELKMTMATLYQALAELGLPKKYVQQFALPDWWDPELEDSPGGLPTGAAYVSRRLNLEFDSLMAGKPQFSQAYHAKFKLKAGTDSEKLRVGYAIALRLAELIAYCCPQGYGLAGQLSARRIREQILATHSEVNLGAVLGWCWNQGIPVVHFNNHPPKSHKFQGMIIRCPVRGSAPRPVIVISYKHKSPSKLLFILAHELGHLLKGHLGDDDFILDEQVKFNDCGDDQEEQEADRFAMELLTGDEQAQYPFPRFATGEQLLEVIEEHKSKYPTVDRGVFANNYGWQMECWGAVGKALNCIEAGQYAPMMINEKLGQCIDQDLLSEDHQEYIEQMLFNTVVEG